MNLGYDYIVIETNDIVSFLKETKNISSHFSIYINLMHYVIHFTFLFIKDISHLLCIYPFKKYSLLHYLFLIFKFPQIIFTLAFISTLFILPHYIYDYKITGSLSIVNNQLQKDLNKQIQ